MRLFFLAILIIFLTGLILFGLDDAAISTAGTSIPAQTPSGLGIRLSSQHGAFYAKGRYWLFYYDTDEEISFKSSTDGESWSSATKIGDAALYGATFDVVFDSTYVHYARNTAWSAPDYYGIAYRRGVPQSDGSISWSAEEQTVLEDTEVANDMQLAVDSDRYVWIGYGGSTTLYFGYPTVIKSSTNDGTWATASGFPHVFFDEEDWMVVPVPQTLGKMYCIVYRTDYTEEVIKGYAWDGSSWRASENATTSLLSNPSGRPISGYFGMVSAVAIGDDIHLAFTTSDDELKYVKRSSGAWSSESMIENTLTYWSSSPVLTKRLNGDLVCFWIYSDESTTTSYYKECINGTWDTDATGLLITDLPTTYSCSLQSYYEEYVGALGQVVLVYQPVIAAGPPYDILHLVITTVPRIHETGTFSKGEYNL